MRTPPSHPHARRDRPEMVDSSFHDPLPPFILSWSTLYQESTWQLEAGKAQ